jgi:hypothetical protein
MNANELADELENKPLAYGDDIQTWLCEASIMLRQQQAKIERLIGSKPITYGMLTFCKNCGEQNPYQTKTLTDEEIMKCVKQFTYARYYDDFFKFAKKLLRKAQEK